jgi:hypothetical protein
LTTGPAAITLPCFPGVDRTVDELARTSIFPAVLASPGNSGGNTCFTAVAIAAHHLFF